MNDTPGSMAGNQPESAGPEASAAGYRVLARKYRPRTFEDLIGQDAMVRTLKNAFETGRIAQAYMLTGVRGIGKTTTARLIARALNYSGSDKPTVDMPEFGEHCAAILESRHVDVIEMDAASKTGIADVREIIDSVRYRPISARYKVYIIDEVHMLSRQAFNALLKTLEEPPEHVKFVFATTEIRKVPVTVLSRCQRFDLRRLDAALLKQHFANVCEREGVTADDEALAMIARAAEGSVRDGLSLLDQAIAYGGRTVVGDQVQSMLGLIDQVHVFNVFDAVMKGDAAAALTSLEEQYAAGADPYTLIGDLARFTHWVTRLKLVPDDGGRSARTEAERKRGAECAERLAMPHLTRAWQMLVKGLQEMAVSANPQMTAEMILIRLAYAASLPSPADLVQQLKGTPPAPGRATTDGTSPASAAAPPRASDPAPQPGLPGPQGSSGPTASTATAPVLHDGDAPQVESAAGAQPVLRTFHDVIDFVGEHRDIKLKAQLERLVRPVSVSPGSIEIALEPDAPPGLPGELGRKLEAWTGARWLVMVSTRTGDSPVHQQRQARAASLLDEARRNADVRVVLEMFPGAEIVSVEPPDHDALDAAVPGDDNAPESGEN